MVSFTLSAILALLATAASALPASGCTATYTVIKDDSCNSIVSAYNNTFTTVDLYAWNPFIDKKCLIWVGETLCVGQANYTYTGPIQGGAIYTPAQNPCPVQPETVSNCTKYEYTLDAIPSYSQLLSDNQITDKQWQSWNWPQESTSGLAWTGYFSCVATN